MKKAKKIQDKADKIEVGEKRKNILSFKKVMIMVTIGVLSWEVGGVVIGDPLPEEGAVGYAKRVSTEEQKQKAGFSLSRYREVFGAASVEMPIDRNTGLGASDEKSRENARMLLENTTLKEMHENPIQRDNLQKYLWEGIDGKAFTKIQNWKLRDLRSFLLKASEDEIKAIRQGLSPDAIAALVKIMSEEELIQVSQKIFNSLPNSKIGSKGYFGARIQPNSPTDNPEDIFWQVMNGFAFGVGDVMLGTNNVDSTVESVANVERTLKDIVDTFGIQKDLPYVVLAHVDVQKAVEEKYPGLTNYWFQSIAGTDKTNKTFNIKVEPSAKPALEKNDQELADTKNPSMQDYARMRGAEVNALYLETGEGSEATNNQGHLQDDEEKGVDAGTLESYKQNLVSRLNALTARKNTTTNPVTGFIGPEVFKTKERLKRMILENTLMGKLHGNTIGLDICATMHMDIDIDDLRWAINEVMPANPAFMMALPTNNDPMLSYLTTCFQDHVKVRHDFKFKVDDKMQDFFKSLDIYDEQGEPACGKFGNPAWVYLKFRRIKGDQRDDETIMNEAKQKMEEVMARGVPLAIGYEEHPWEMNKKMDKKIRALVQDSKYCLKQEFPKDYAKTFSSSVEVHTKACSREEYINLPPLGEDLAEQSWEVIKELKETREKQGKNPDIQIIISDGLNALAILDKGHVDAFLPALQEELAKADLGQVAQEIIVMNRGRVRAGYAIGEKLFGESGNEGEATETRKTIIHIIGERPGSGLPADDSEDQSGHNNFSAYISVGNRDLWSGKSGVKMDHGIVDLVSGISDSSTDPKLAAQKVVELIKARIQMQQEQ